MREKREKERQGREGEDHFSCCARGTKSTGK